uniref:Uncharacterized protein n=1 Tax=Opuntia streptacantha TaxID=393608 RepID=A0A7C9EDX2_OPUST
MGKHHTPSLQAPHAAFAVDDAAVKVPVKLPPPMPSENQSKPQINCSKLTKKNKKRFNDEAASSSSSEVISCTTRNRDHNNFSMRGIRIASKRRNPRFSVRRAASDVEALAFPLGMSIAAVLAQICTSAVRESLSNVSHISK